MSMPVLEHGSAFLDRSRWRPGPWDRELWDKAQWKDPATGLQCLAVRNHWGAWCGYVGIPYGHPLHGKNAPHVDADVHWGVNFANPCQDAEKPGSVCHIPAEGEPGHLWWFGFDCNHAFDLAPVPIIEGLDAVVALLEEDAHYRDLNYVAGECARLAGWLAHHPVRVEG